jgi:hypothetical protein
MEGAVPGKIIAMLQTTLKLAVAILAVAAMVSTADAKPAKRQGLVIVDANTGKVLKDDGKLDGKGCAVGSKAVYNPSTGTFTKVPAVKCNF